MIHTECRYLAWSDLHVDFLDVPWECIPNFNFIAWWRYEYQGVFNIFAADCWEVINTIWIITFIVFKDIYWAAGETELQGFWDDGHRGRWEGLTLARILNWEWRYKMESTNVTYFDDTFGIEWDNLVCAFYGLNWQNGR